MSRSKTLSPGQRAALPAIRSLLRLSGAKLTQSECESLCSCFYSVPYDHRSDELTMSGYLELAKLGIRAMSRAETFKTISESPDLQQMVKDLLASVQGLLPRTQSGATK